VKSFYGLRAVHSDRRRTGREVSLGSDNLVVVATKSHALAGPSIEVSLHVHGSAGALVLANRPVLLKGPCSIDGWLVSTGRLSDLVGRAVGSHGTLVASLGTRVIGSVNEISIYPRWKLYREIAYPKFSTT
jgi:hypothetical protein